MPLKLVGPRLAHGGHAARFREEGGEAGLAAVLGCFLPPRSARRGEPPLGPRAQRHTARRGGGDDSPREGRDRNPHNLGEGRGRVSGWHRACSVLGAVSGEPGMRSALEGGVWRRGRAGLA